MSDPEREATSDVKEDLKRLRKAAKRSKRVWNARIGAFKLLKVPLIAAGRNAVATGLALQRAVFSPWHPDVGLALKA